MGMLDTAGWGGFAQGLNQGLNPFVQAMLRKPELQQRQQELEQRNAYQKAMMGEIEAKRIHQERENQDVVSLRRDVKSLYNPETPGLMSDGTYAEDPSMDMRGLTGSATPTSDQLMGVYNRYASPKEGLAAQVSLANTAEKIASAEKLQDVRNRSYAENLVVKIQGALDIVKESNDAQSLRQADKLQADLDKFTLLLDSRHNLQDEKLKNFLEQINLKATVKPPPNTATNDRIERKTAADAEAKLLANKPDAPENEAYASIYNDTGLPDVYVYKEVADPSWYNKDATAKKWVKVPRKGGVPSPSASGAPAGFSDSGKTSGGKKVFTDGKGNAWITP